MSDRLVCKRQLQRRAIAKLKKLSKSVPYVNPDLRQSPNYCFEMCSNHQSAVCAPDSSSLNFNSHILHDERDVPVYKAQETFSLPLEHSYDRCSSESDDDVTNNALNVEIDLLTKLRNWACENNITQRAVTELLHMLHPSFPSLPLDSRTLLSTVRNSPLIKLNNGDMIYFGISNKVKSILLSGVQLKDNSVALQVNIDGLPLFKSSSIEFYPILGFCDTYPPMQRPFPVAIYSGKGKPDPLSDFLKKFIEEVKDLQENGVTFNKQHVSFKIKYFVCDAPARSYLKCVVGHNSKNACERCCAVGKWENNVVHFADCKNQVALRQKNDFLFDNDCVNAHIKSKSPLLELGVDMIEQFPLDPMHLIHLGVVKRILLNYLIEGHRPYKMSQKQRHEINSRILNITKFIPSDFARRPRTLVDIKRWKATEYRMFIMYLTPIVLHDIIDVRLYNHILLLHCAVMILSNQNNLTHDSISTARDLLKKFVYEASDIYGKEFIVYNVHNLLHVCDDVQLYGSLDSYSCFKFENYLGLIKRKIRSKVNPLQQIHRRLLEIETCNKPHLNDISCAKPSVKFDQCYEKSNDNCVSFKCHKLHTGNYVISIAVPDNMVMLKNKKIYAVKEISFINDQYKITGTPFYRSSNLYDRPLQSSSLLIFYVQRDGNKSTTFTLNDILCKCIGLPHGDGYAVYPLNRNI